MKQIINMRKSCTILVMVFLGVVTPDQSSQSARPNVILIVADDLGWDDVSFHGSEIPTPNIDALAYDGIILNNYYVQPICTPTRSALMTGRHPIHTGLQHGVIVGSAPYGLGLDEKLLPEYLRELGYANHMVGKWHLGFFAEEYTPTFRGFDSHLGYYNGMEDYWDHTYCSRSTDKDRWGLDFYDDMKLVKNAFGQYSTEIFTKRAEDIIAKHNTSQPLFLYLPHQAVHSGDPITPLEAPYKYLQKVKHIKDKNRRTFAGMVSALDDSIGNVTQALNARDMLENSIIIFTTDNGGPAAGFDMNHASNWPLRGLKSLLWEGGVRGTGFIWSPKLHESNYVSPQLLSVYDWLPTILRAVGYNTSALPKNVDGLNQWDALSYNIKSQRSELLHNIDPVQGTAALRKDNMKVIMGEAYRGTWDGWYKPESVSNWQARLSQMKNSNEDVMMMEKEYAESAFEIQEQVSKVTPVLKSLGRSLGDHKPVIVKCGPKPANASTNCQPSKQPCLYNIVVDPCEYNNIASKNPDVLQDLMNRLLDYKATAVMPRNKPEDPRGYPVHHDYAWVPWINLTHVAKP